MSQTSQAQRSQPFDAVTLEILWRRTIFGGGRGGHKALRRTFLSMLVNESNDFACVLTDAASTSGASASPSVNIE